METFKWGAMMKPFIKYDDGSVEQSYLAHMFYLASLGFSIVPGSIAINGIPVNYEALSSGIKITKKDGKSMVLPFKQAMAMVSRSGADDQL